LLEHARQVFETLSQIGFTPPQSLLARQPTQVLVGTWQTGVEPVQAL
jgi:hypothetical protein